MSRVRMPTLRAAGARGGTRGGTRGRRGDLDLLRLGLLGLGQPQRQHAILVLGLGLAGVDRGREAHHALELAVAALAQVIMLVLLLLLGLDLAADGQRIAVGGDLDVFGPHARQRRLDDELVLILGDVQGERRGAVVQQADGTDEALLQQRVHRFAEANRLAERLPALDRHGC